jgi:predicted DNA-binding protein
MKGKKAGTRNMKTPSETSARASISFPLDLYEALEELAKQKKVSLAWIVRDAAERYIADQKSPAGRPADQ